MVLNDNPDNRFCDQLFLVDTAAGAIDHVPACCSTPGDDWKHAVTNAPKLRPGAVNFTRGMHHDKYPCLVQYQGDESGMAAVTRGVDSAGNWTMTGSALNYCQDTGFHIHHASVEGEEPVDEESEWLLVVHYVFGLYADQNVIPYTIAPPGSPTPRYVTDKQGAEMQKMRAFLLAHDGVSLPPPGRWDTAVDREYLSHQKAAGEPLTGVSENPWFLA